MLEMNLVKPTDCVTRYALIAARLLEQIGSAAQSEIEVALK